MVEEVEFIQSGFFRLWLHSSADQKFYSECRRRQMPHSVTETDVEAARPGRGRPAPPPSDVAPGRGRI